MKPSELRIGNWYESQNGSLKGVRDGNYSQIEEPGDLLFAQFMLPIPLTEEWLLRFGFKNLNNNPYWLSLIHNGTGIHIGTNSNVELQFFLGDGTVKTKLKLNYVHQLQNLFFALTGEELTIN